MMIYYCDTTDFSQKGPTAVTLGKFDGLHRGHCKLFEKIRQMKESEGLQSVAFTFNAKSSRLILTGEEQRSLFETFGFDVLIRCPFVPEISHMTPEEFVRVILKQRLNAAAVVVGTDFRFGYKRAGDAGILCREAARYGMTVKVVEKETYEGREISSTYVREALEQGNVVLAEKLLGRPFGISGRVVHGAHLGSAMGMPTANLIPTEEKLMPRFGVYASDVWYEDRYYPSLTNIGTKPTVDGSFVGVETYIFDADLNLYDKDIRIDLKAFIRPEEKFGSVLALREQVGRDIAYVRTVLEKH